MANIGQPRRKIVVPPSPAHPPRREAPRPVKEPVKQPEKYPEKVPA